MLNYSKKSDLKMLRYLNILKKNIVHDFLKNVHDIENLLMHFKNCS
jgi:hypothetical protein